MNQPPLSRDCGTDESLEDASTLPAPDVLAGEIAENLETALEQFKSIYESLASE